MSEKAAPYEAEVTTENQGFFGGFLNSFRQHPSQVASDKRRVDADSGRVDLEAAAIAVAESPLSRRLKGRHLQMIAIGGSIGSGLFVGSGKALAAGGPASLLIAFSLIGAMLFTTVHALGELAVLFPVAGSFAVYSTRFLDPAWGFAMGWKCVTLPCFGSRLAAD
jgi:amino acid transporter